MLYGGGGGGGGGGGVNMEISFISNIKLAGKKYSHIQTLPTADAIKEKGCNYVKQWDKDKFGFWIILKKHIQVVTSDIIFLQLNSESNLNIFQWKASTYSRYWFLHHGHRWAGDIRGHSISSHDIDLDCPE